jgi:uncharacterized protein (DUF885 family)
MGGAAMAFAAVAPRPLPAQAPRKQLNRLFDSFVDADLNASPEEASSLGLDTGMRARQRSLLDERTLTSRLQDRARIAKQLAQLQTLDRTSLSGMDGVNYDVVRFGLELADRAAKRFEYGPLAAGAPYVVSPLTGTYSAIPDFLDGQHQIGSPADADAYVQRLTAFAVAMDQENELVRHDAAHGCLPPDFALVRTLDQMRLLRSAEPQSATMVTSLQRRVKALGLPGDQAVAAAKIVSRQVYPALDRQMALIREMQAQATHDAGVWKFRNGDEYYAASLMTWTSSPLNPAEIHKLGLEAVRDHTARVDSIMQQRGLSHGTVAERLRGMFTDARFRYPNTEAGKETLVGQLNAKVQAVRAKLPQYFGVLPKADVIVRRVPAYMEEARPSGYYQPPSLDGARAGAFYINLRDTAETPSWTLATQAYHESVPGHHVKLSIYQETKLPLIRKIAFFSAYMEGWSFYAEQLAEEMGVYDDDPFGRLGYLHAALRASAALVVDTGMHAMRWSREQAIEYYADTLGDPSASVTTEIERYCIWPGQVCSYMLDRTAILGLRDKARTALGARFDIRRFHDAVLLCGAVPQQVLAEVVGEYARAAGA